MNDKKYFLYVLRCVDKSLYTGITTDVKRRFSEHSSSGKLGAKYMHLHKPVSVEFALECPSRAIASKLEYAFKHITKEKKEKFLCNPELMIIEFGEKFDLSMCKIINEYAGYKICDE